MQIRPATADDARAIAEVHVSSWRGAYRGVLPEDVLDGLDVDQRAAGWTRALASTEQGTVVAEDAGGRIVAFVQAAPARDDDADATTGEVTTIYALPEAWGTGVGRSLMAAAVDWLCAAGYRTATLWVLENNPRARRFYERAGWAPDGTAKDDVLRGTPVREVRYRRSLR